MTWRDILFGLGIGLVLAALLSTCNRPAHAETITETTPQLYAALENGILVLTTDPCDAHFGQPSMFEYAAYAVVFDEPGAKVGCWFRDDTGVVMIFEDQPGIHNWATWMFGPKVPEGGQK